MRLIDADELMRRFMYKQAEYYHASYIVGEINTAPTIYAEPEGCPFYIENKNDRGDDSMCRLFHSEVKYLAIETRQVGEWIDDNCSLCGQYVYHGDARNYCPNCGAKMETDNET